MGWVWVREVVDGENVVGVIASVSVNEMFYFAAFHT